MVRVCDAIMGTGKSQSTITYINEHKDQRFIYITPYLDEATRIKDGCPDAHFVEPSNKLKEFGFKKTAHTASLISRGCNIATTHQAFKGYTPEMLEDIKSMEYTLIIDENVDVLEVFNMHPGDLQMAVDAGYISCDNDIYSIANDEYNGVALSDLFRMLKSRELIRVEENGMSLFYWTLPPDLITSFKDVFILTYLFEGQSLHHLLEIYNIPYTKIGVERIDHGAGFRFCKYPGYTPEYVSHLGDMLHIVDKEKINSVGDEYYALSMNWFKRDEDGVEQLKKNMHNYFNNIMRDVPADEKMWGGYNGEYGRIRGKGYTKSFLTFNTKATNEYRDRKCLVYITNLFMNVNEKTFYTMHGIDVDEDMYALSVMVQWIWRSAIRDGQPVDLYIPSKRMRTLLTNWIDTVSKGGAEND